MARKIRYSNLSSKTARDRLKRGRQAHWEDLAIEGLTVHLGYQRWKGDPAGHWLLRRYIGKGTSKHGKVVARYRTSSLGLADDGAALADDERVLSYKQANTKARTMVATPSDVADKTVDRITVREAFELYIAQKRNRGKPIADDLSRGTAHILPSLGDLVVAKLIADELEKWLGTMARGPAQTRPKDGKPQYRPAPKTNDEVRARQATANRVLALLKAVLNHAFDKGRVSNRNAWGRKLKPFENVDVARTRYLTVAEADRLLNACDAEFRPLVRAALETGCRYNELARLKAQDFNPDANTLTVLRSKSGKAPHVILTPEGANFFRQHCAGLAGHELMFRRANGATWNKSDQARPMRDACTHARITPPIGFHGLRHTWASLAVMKNMPLMVVAENLGHANTKMVQKHYGHLSKSYIVEAIYASAPRFAASTSDTTVRPLQKPARTP